MDTCGHVGWQIKNTKETTNPNRKGRNADPPARCAFRHPAEKQQSKMRTGQGPTKTTTTKIWRESGTDRFFFLWYGRSRSKAGTDRNGLLNLVLSEGRLHPRS